MTSTTTTTILSPEVGVLLRAFLDGDLTTAQASAGLDVLARHRACRHGSECCRGRFIL